MQNRPWKQVLVPAVLLALLSVAGLYLMRGRGILPRFLDGPTEIQQQPAANQEISAGLKAPRSITGTGNGAPGHSEAAVLLEEWLKSIEKNDATRTSELMQAMIQRLHVNPNRNEEFYQRVRKILEDPSIDAGRKHELIAALDRAATSAAFGLLADLAQQKLPAELKRGVLNALANTGEYYWEDIEKSQVAPVLQQLWAQSDDPEILRSVGIALAKISDMASINALVEAVLRGNKSLVDVQKSNDPRTSAAWASLQRLQPAAAVPVIQQELQTSDNAIQASIYAHILATMGSNEAVQGLLSWAQNAGDSFTSVAQDAFSNLSTFDSIQYAKSAMARNPAFKSNRIKSAILSSLKM